MRKTKKVGPTPVVSNTSKYKFPASLNRWTGQPHEHKRAIARRLRQEGKELS